LIVDPPDGRQPTQVPDAQKRAADAQAARKGRGPADSYTDRSLYDRCVTRGVLGSILPVIYNNGNEIVQAPGVVVIRNEMIHETRIVPLDGRPHLTPSIKGYMGDSRGWWDGNTLVVETTNLNGAMAWVRTARIDQRSHQADRAVHAGRCEHAAVRSHHR
jgi:hypothetical protein